MSRREEGEAEEEDPFPMKPLNLRDFLAFLPLEEEEGASCHEAAAAEAERGEERKELGREEKEEGEGGGDS